jgi:hypothetical protein
MAHHRFCKYLSTLLFVLSTTSSVHAQIDSVLGFFPLNNGDVHQNMTWGENPSRLIREDVLGDTLLPTGFAYKIIESTWPDNPGEKFVRVDSTTGNVYRFAPSTQPPRSCSTVFGPALLGYSDAKGGSERTSPVRIPRPYL